MTARISSSAATTSVGVFDPALKNALHWNLDHGASGRSSPRWKKRSRPSAGLTSIEQFVTPQMRAQVSPTCGQAVQTAIRS